MDGLKQRIIGALVLVSLAVIFVPMIFDEPHSQRQSTPITIPEEPPFPEVEMPESQYPDNKTVGAEAPRSSAPPVNDVVDAGAIRRAPNLNAGSWRSVLLMPSQTPASSEAAA